MLRYFKSKKVAGDIAYYNLQKWWFDSFSEEDREWMAKTYAPMGFQEKPLIEGRGLAATRHPFYYLSNVGAWFSKPGYQHCAIEFIKKAMAFYDESIPILDRHFGLTNQCKVFYRWRDEVPGALDAAVHACETCISFHRDAAVELEKELGMVPGHACFHQLRIIEEKRGNYERAIQLCEMAKEGGWTGNWDKDIARLRKKNE